MSDKRAFLAKASPAIDALKALAAKSGDALYLCDGPVNPDHHLLDLCAEALYANKQAERLMDEWRDGRVGSAGGPTAGEVQAVSKTGDLGLFAQIMREAEEQKARAAERARRERESYDQAREWRQKSRTAMRAAGKLQATTAAGIYAKALLVKTSAGAAVLAQSLADDFIACEGLRTSLWPAEAQSCVS